MAHRKERSAASEAAEQVRSILEAAEGSAAALEEAAREDAARIRAAAEADAAATRAAVGRFGERADELARRLDQLAETVRTELASLRQELAALRARASEAGAASRPEAASEAEETGEGEVTSEGEQREAEEAPDVDATIAEAETLAAREPELATGNGAEEPARVDAPEGARVLALKMALDGTPRADTASYLKENFDLEDPEALLDEVYARAGR